MTAEQLVVSLTVLQSQTFVYGTFSEDVNLKLKCCSSSQHWSPNCRSSVARC